MKNFFLLFNHKGKLTSSKVSVVANRRASLRTDLTVKPGQPLTRRLQLRCPCRRRSPPPGEGRPAGRRCRRSGSQAQRAAATFGCTCRYQQSSCCRRRQRRSRSCRRSFRRRRCSCRRPKCCRRRRCRTGPVLGEK